MRLSCEGQRDGETERQRDRDKTETRQRQSGLASTCCAPFCGFLSKFVCTRVLMSEWQDVMTRRMRRRQKQAKGRQPQSGMRLPEWQCSLWQTRSFLSRSTCLGCGMDRAKKKDVYINEWALLAPWRPGSRTGAAAAGKCEGDAPARAVHPHLGGLGGAGRSGHETSSALDRRWTKCGPSLSRSTCRGECLASTFLVRDLHCAGDLKMLCHARGSFWGCSRCLRQEAACQIHAEPLASARLASAPPRHRSTFITALCPNTSYRETTHTKSKEAQVRRGSCPSVSEFDFLTITCFVRTSPRHAWSRCLRGSVTWSAPRASPRVLTVSVTRPGSCSPSAQCLRS